MVEYLPCMYVRNHGSESHLRQLFLKKGKWVVSGVVVLYCLPFA